MACSNCEYKGFIESEQRHSAAMRPLLSQCPKCKDTKRYSREVSKRYGQPMPENERPTAQVFQLRSIPIHILKPDKEYD